jgi:transcriptional regulator with XRE-family HTH domain
MTTRLTPTQAFARSVKKGRQLLDWNQQQLAERLTELGLPTRQSTVARIETGKRGVSLDDAVALSIALDIALPNMIAGAAADGCELTLAPKEVWPADLANANLRGDFSLNAGELGWGNYYRLDLRSREDRERLRRQWEELRSQGKIRREVSEDGTVTEIRVDDQGGES